jgi:hypothetical protein
MTVQSDKVIALSVVIICCLTSVESAVCLLNTVVFRTEPQKYESLNLHRNAKSYVLWIIHACFCLSPTHSHTVVLFLSQSHTC